MLILSNLSLGTLFFVWWENEGKQNRNQSKVLGFSLGLCLFFCFVFWGLICSDESDIAGWFNRGEISGFWLVAEKLLDKWKKLILGFLSDSYNAYSDQIRFKISGTPSK